MRIVEQIIASLVYHRKNTGFLLVSSVITVIVTSYFALLYSLEQIAQSTLQKRLNVFSSKSLANASTIIQSLKKAHATLLQSYQFQLNLFVAILVIAMASYQIIYLRSRRHEFKAYLTIGKSPLAVAWQYTSEIILVFLFIYTISNLVFLLFSKQLLIKFGELNNGDYLRELPHNIISLYQANSTDKGWSVINQLFSQHITAFNGHGLLFGTNYDLDGLLTSPVFFVIVLIVGICIYGLLSFVIAWWQAGLIRTQLNRK